VFVRIDRCHVSSVFILCRTRRSIPQGADRELSPARRVDVRACGDIRTDRYAGDDA
jgi:hypothetical protein